MAVDNSLLNTTGAFLIRIGEDNKLLSEAVVEFTLPSLTVTPINSEYRNQSGFTPGENATTSELTLSFLCDENMVTYETLYDWMKRNITHPDKLVVDISISILTSHQNQNRSIVLTDAFPTSLSAVTFAVGADEEQYARFEVSFRFDEYLFKAKV